MKEGKQILTTADKYTDKYNGEYSGYYQIHILSFNQIFSTYFNPQNISIEQLSTNAKSVIVEIQRKSHLSKPPALFEKNGKFLIAADENILDPVELFEFNTEFVRYEAVYDYDDLFDFLGSIQVDVFIKNALTTVGADDLISAVEHQIDILLRHQQNSIDYYNKCRELDKAQPKYVIEIFKIEKNYVPVKLQEIQSNDIDNTTYLPENRYLIKSENRFAYVAKEIISGKIIENTIADTIESIKYHKHLRKNPTIIDADALRRMELDSDDPDSLSWDEHVNNDDDFEEGDDEYVPR